MPVDGNDTQSLLLKTERAAVYMGLSASTLNKLRTQGGGPRYLKVGRSVFYTQQDINVWLDGARRSSTSVAYGGA